MTDDDLTRFGFTWGQVTVERTAEIDGKRVLRVMTNAGKALEIYASPGGQSLRVFRDGKELS